MPKNKTLSFQFVGATLLGCLLVSVARPQSLPVELPPYRSYAAPSPPGLPPAGETLVDPTFGSVILRVTDSRDGANNYHAYAYWPTLNLDSSRLYISSVGGEATLYDFDPVGMSISNKRLAFPPLPNGARPDAEDATWSWTNPDKMFVHDRKLLLWEYDVNTGAYELVKDWRPAFPPGHHSNQMHWAYSKDDVVCFAWKDEDQNSIGVFAWSRSADRLWKFQMAKIDECTVDKTGRYLEIATGNQGRGVIETIFVDLQTDRRTNIQDDGPTDPNQLGTYWAPGHGDVGAGLRVGYENWNNRMLFRRHATPGQFSTLLNFNNDWTVGNHVSMLADDESWATVSTFATSPGAPDLWKNQIFQMATDGSGGIRRLVHHHSNKDDYWARPRASISKDGRYVTFDSSWGSTSRTDVFVARVGGPPPGPTFTIAGTPASQTAILGSGATYTVAVTPQSSFQGVVRFTASGLPAGVAATFTPLTLTGGGSTSLQLSTTNSTPSGGPYPITITATSGTLVRRATVNLTVADFRLSGPAALFLTPGDSASFALAVLTTGSFAETVRFQASGLPTGTSATFSPPSVTGSGSSQVRIDVSPSTPLGGPHPLTITGTGGSLVRTASMTLVVKAPPLPSRTRIP